MKAIGIDIGASFTKTAVVDRRGKVLHQKSAAHFAKNPADLIKKTANLINNLKKIYDGEKTVIGVGIAGIIDTKKGIIRYSPNLKKWKNVKFLTPLSKKIKSKIFIENDANMSAWGAYTYELKKKYKDILVLTLGSGIGGGIIIGGKLLSGAKMSAGEIGHIKIDPASGPKCNCSNRGCLESYAGGYATISRAKKLIENFKGKTILTQKGLSAENLNLAAQRGDKLALDIWHQMGFYLGVGIANAVFLLNPQVVLLCGGLTKAHKFFIPELKKVLKNQKIKTPFENLKIKISTNPSLGAIGAAFYASGKNK